MYCPAAFVEQRPEVLVQAMQAYPLATVVHQGARGTDAEHVPLLYLPPDAAAGAGQWGSLVGHVARANALWQLEGRECLLVFQGPQCYVSPSWYASKAETGKAVPTWNYVVVHVRARLHAVQAPDEVLSIIRRQTAWQESQLPHPWQVDDAPPDFVQALLRAIVGLRFDVLSVAGKWKVSQNRPQPDRDSLVQVLAGGSAMQQAMARLVAGQGDQ